MRSPRQRDEGEEEEEEEGAERRAPIKSQKRGKRVIKIEDGSEHLEMDLVSRRYLIGGNECVCQRRGGTLLIQRTRCRPR